MLVSNLAIDSSVGLGLGGVGWTEGGLRVEEDAFILISCPEKVGDSAWAGGRGVGDRDRVPIIEARGGGVSLGSAMLSGDIVGLS